MSLPPSAPDDMLHVSVGFCPPPDQMKDLWLELEGRAELSPFLSWTWIATLLECTPAPLRLVRVTAQGRLVGLGLLGGRERSFCLNESGDPGLDSVMIEYNGVLTERGQEAAARAALLASLEGGRLFLSGVGPEWSDAAAKQGLIFRLHRHPQPVAFATLPAEGDLFDRFSRNTRQQIRRSIRFFEAHGPLMLDHAADADQALNWFDALETLHTASWRDRGKAGAFAAPAFGTFHRRLIRRGTADRVVDLFRLRVGDHPIGYLYNLLWRGTSYAYQSGFERGTDPRSRPGLVAHVLAMEHYRKSGVTAYNFLAGAARYKESLSDGCETLYWASVSQPGLRNSLADLVASPLKRAWGRLFESSGR